MKYQTDFNSPKEIINYLDSKEIIEEIKLNAYYRYINGISNNEIYNYSQAKREIEDYYYKMYYDFKEDLEWEKYENKIKKQKFAYGLIKLFLISLLCGIIPAIIISLIFDII